LSKWGFSVEGLKLGRGPPRTPKRHQEEVEMKTKLLVTVSKDEKTDKEKSIFLKNFQKALKVTDLITALKHMNFNV
jgi:hypothetical protein